MSSGMQTNIYIRTVNVGCIQEAEYFASWFLCAYCISLLAILHV